MKRFPGWILFWLMAFAASGAAAVTQRAQPVHVKILAINDFHGQLTAGETVAGRPVGSAPVLASYLRRAAAGEAFSFIVHAGDLVGASPPQSGLLQGEPSIMFFNLFANRFCSYRRRTDPRCNLVATVGNHEFDQGREELLRLIYGGNHARGPYLENPYRGAKFPYVCANVKYADADHYLLPPYVIKEAGEIRIAFIGALLQGMRTKVMASGIRGLVFLDEASSVNRQVKRLQALGIHAIVLLIHQGGDQQAYSGPTRQEAPPLSGAIVGIVRNLDDDIDLVISAHTHRFTNALVNNRHGVPILVTQAEARSRAYAVIDLLVDGGTDDVVSKSARIMTTWADGGPGLDPDPEAKQLVKEAQRATFPLVHRFIGRARCNITRETSPSGESALGDLVADAQRAALKADFCFTNPGGLRSDIKAGNVTWGDLYAVQPFHDELIRMKLSGRQIYQLLNQQWRDPAKIRILQVSGLDYTWDGTRPPGERIVEIRRDGVPIDRNAFYTVAVNRFLAEGGDGFSVFAHGGGHSVGPFDREALVSYIRRLPQPFCVETAGRIKRIR